MTDEQNTERLQTNNEIKTQEIDIQKQISNNQKQSSLSPGTSIAT